MKHILYLLLLIPSLSWAETKVTGAELSTTAVLGIIKSSSTYPSPSYTTTQTTLVQCVAGSTITLVTSGGPIEVTFAGYTTPSATGIQYSGFLINGGYPSGYAANIPIMGHSIPAGTTGTNLGFSFLTEPLTAGSYNFCLTVATSAGTLGFNAKPRFYVKELR